MCGRFSLFTPPDDVESRFDAAFVEGYEPTYNAAPGQALPVVADETPAEIRRFEWGLVPSWAEDRSDFGVINARAETVAEKRSFADAYENRRCLVPADGFYEWTERGGGKQPYRITVGDGELFAMAGLWERWTPPGTQTGLGDFGGGEGANGGPGGDPEPVETFTIVTTEPNDVVADLHDRMPVVLGEDQEDRWLSGDATEAGAVLDPYPAERTRAYPVSTAINSPANDAPELVEPVEVGS